MCVCVYRVKLDFTTTIALSRNCERERERVMKLEGGERGGVRGEGVIDWFDVLRERGA